MAEHARCPPCEQVAHNAVNQALLGTAAGWGPDAFRRFEQSNGALTVRRFPAYNLYTRMALVDLPTFLQTLRLAPGVPGGAPAVVVECMNAAPEGPPLGGTGARVLLAPAGDPAAAAALGALLATAPLAALLHAPGARSRATAAAVAAGRAAPCPLLVRCTCVPCSHLSG